MVVDCLFSLCLQAGFDRGGQTREHAMLAKTLGIQKLVILVNKMDDPGVKWAKTRYDEIEGKLSPFLKKCGFNMKTGKSMIIHVYSFIGQTFPFILRHCDRINAVQLTKIYLHHSAQNRSPDTDSNFICTIFLLLLIVLFVFLFRCCLYSCLWFHRCEH